MDVLLDVSAYQSPDALDALLTTGVDGDVIVGVYIKLTQGTDYANSSALAHARIAFRHNTPFGWYHFMTDEDCTAQAGWFLSKSVFSPDELPIKPGLRPLLDCEAPYSKGALGVTHFANAANLRPALYANRSDVETYSYHVLGWPLLIAEYDGGFSQPEEAVLARLGAVAWQFTDAYGGGNQDASAVIDFAALRAV